MARVIHTRRPTIPAIQPRKRVAAYARVSIEKETMIESLVAQVGYYRTHIQRNPEWYYVPIAWKMVEIVAIILDNKMRRSRRNEAYNCSDYLIFTDNRQNS